MNPLQYVGHQLRELFLLIPMWVVQGLFIAVPLLLMIWIIRQPEAAATPPGHSHRWDEDLRVWAWVALALQVVLYCVF
jgi:hypothetical protein